MTAPRTQGKDNQYWTGFPLRFFICAWKYHPSFGWLSPEIRKDGINMYYDVEKTAEIIKKLRNKKGVTQEQASREMEINIKTIQSAEQGTRGLSIDTLCIIGNYYGTTLDYLITGERKDMQKCFSYLSRLSENQSTKIDNIIVNLIDTLEW